MNSDDAPAEPDESTAESPAQIRHASSGSERPSTAVIEAVTATTDREPTTMPPLYDHIEPDALDALLTPRATSAANPITVTFTYDGVTVRIDSSGRVEIQEDGAARDYRPGSA